MYQYYKVETSTASNKAHADILNEVFNKPEQFTQEYIAWQYDQNPQGKIIGYNAYSGNIIAAHYVTQPLLANLNGKLTKGVLSLNTATNEHHRGKGLFTKLADKTYEYAASEGYKFVIGVANKNSVHGLVNKLGFQNVGQLDVKIGVGKTPEDRAPTDVQYAQHWEEESLKWRLSNPTSRYLTYGHSGVYYSRTHLPMVKAQLIKTLGNVTEYGLESIGLQPFTLYIGKEAGLSFKNKLYLDIPEKLKPSPLHLVFKDLTGTNTKLDPDNICFKLIDFDAY